MSDDREPEDLALALSSYTDRINRDLYWNFSYSYFGPSETRLIATIRRCRIDPDRKCADSIRSLVRLGWYGAAAAMFEKVATEHVSADVRRRTIKATPAVMTQHILLAAHGNYLPVSAWAGWRDFKRAYCRLMPTTKTPKLDFRAPREHKKWSDCLLEPNGNLELVSTSICYFNPGVLSDIVTRIILGWRPHVHPYWQDVYISRVVAARAALRLMEERARADPELCAQPGRSVSTNLFAELVLGYV